MYQDRGSASDEWLNPYKAHLRWLPMFFWRSGPDVTMAAVTTKWTVVFTLCALAIATATMAVNSHQVMGMIIAWNNAPSLLTRTGKRALLPRPGRVLLEVDAYGCELGSRAVGLNLN